MTLEVLFLVSRLAFPAGPDTVKSVEFQRLDPPRTVLACVQAPAAAWVISISDTATARFEREAGDRSQDPMDVAAAYRGAMQICVTLDARPWKTCSVYLGDVFLGVFVRTGQAPPPGRGRKDVPERFNFDE